MSSLRAPRFLSQWILFALLFLSTSFSRAGDVAYKASVDRANIAPMGMAASQGNVEVSGQPRMTQGHPCTVWDKEDIAHYKEMLKTSKQLQENLAEIQTDMDLRISQPLDIPEPQKGADGNWLYPGEYFPAYPDKQGEGATARFSRRIQRNAAEMIDLATLYALTGDEKYGNFCKQMFLAYANFPRYGKPPVYTMRSGVGIVGALFDEGLTVTKWARAYDLIYNLPSWTPEEHKRIHDDLFKPFIDEFFYPAGVDHDPVGGGYFASQANNRGCLANCSALLAGYATDDQDWINGALYGVEPTQKTIIQERLTQFPLSEDWKPCTADKPIGGLLQTDMGKCIGDDGVWIEGSPTYAFYALPSLINSAETLWHHGIDLYRYRNGILKGLFDYPLVLAYPDMTIPAVNDAQRVREAYGYTPVLYEYAYRRYRDPSYLPIINSQMITETEKKLYRGAILNVWKPIDPTAPPTPPMSFQTLRCSVIGSSPPSFLYDLNPNEASNRVVARDMNFTSVGLGILRTPSESGMNSLLMSYGPSASHGHPDKLGIDLFAFDDVLMPSPGVKFPYSNPLLPKWFHTTLAHNDLTVDEKSQITFGDLNTYPKGTPNPQADQLVYGPAATVGIQRASSDTAYTGVTLDRSLFLTSHYLADLFAAFSSSPHKYDLAWHIRGDFASDLKLEPMTFPDPVANGYNTLNNLRHATVDKDWSGSLTRDKHVARFFGTAGPGTEVIVGDGGVYVDGTVEENAQPNKPPTIIERRVNSTATIFGNAVDISGVDDGYIKKISQEGGVDLGYALLRVTTKTGTDLCFASYQPGTYKPEGLETDALLAFVQQNGNNVEILYLAGGKSLKANGCSITRSEAGLAYVEKTPDGNYIVANPSPTDATVTLTFPALADLTAFTLDDKGQKGEAFNVTKDGTTLSLQLKSGKKVIFAKK